MTAICPFKASARDGDVCGDCDKPYAPDMVCGLLGATLEGAAITAGTAAVCDDGDICEACQ